MTIFQLTTNKISSQNSENNKDWDANKSMCKFSINMEPSLTEQLSWLKDDNNNKADRSYRKY